MKDKYMYVDLRTKLESAMTCKSMEYVLCVCVRVCVCVCVGVGVCEWVCVSAC